MQDHISTSEAALGNISEAKRKLLQKYLRGDLEPKPGSSSPIARRPADSSPRLSFSQERLWFLDQLMPGESLYHTSTAERLVGALDVAVLRKALQAIVERHAALRTIFRIVDDEPQQFVDNFSLEVPLIDLSVDSEEDREAQALRILQHEARRPFDLSQGPLIRAVIVRLREREHMLFVAMHHIVTDGWSIGIFNRELSALYEVFATGNPSPLADLPIQYADYSAWQRQWLAGERYESQLAYWKNQFATLPPTLELPTDHPRPNVQAHRAFRGAHHTISLSTELTQRLQRLCQQENVTLFMMLLAAYQVLLYRYTGEEDIVVGTPIAGRQIPETESLIGLFINTLAMRANLAGDVTVRQLLNRVKQAALGAYAHQDLPFDRLVKELQPERTLAHNPLFQVMFVLQSQEILPLQLPGLVAEHFRVDNIMANFDLTLDIVERNEQLVCLFESNADLFESETIERMLGHFQNLLEAIVANPAQKISELPLLSEAERHRLLIEWNETKTDYPSNNCIHELFEQQVAIAPDSVALVWDNRQMSYRELNSRANRLARLLRKRGVGPDTRVGLCVERSPEMIVALLGILKAGGAYVPLDPTYPQLRLDFMLKDAKAPVLLSQRALLSKLPEQAAEIICFDELDEQLAQESDGNPEITTGANNLAYVIYTSGSTGTPKGVAVTHRNVVRLVKNTNYASFSADEVFLQSSTISFDASTFEIWGSLLNGARLALMPAGTPSLQELGEVIKQYRVTTLWLTAGLFHLMVDNRLEDLRGVRQLLAGGDVLSVPHVQKVFAELPGCRLINGYGPTENTTFTCCYPIDDLANVNRSVPIGRPIANTSVYVLDGRMNPTPIGVPGELCIGGDGLARGYLDRPELNAERFIRDPFSTDPSARLYRTGDLARWRATGEIEFIGRIDNQVKVRGFRIEPGEIEAVLAQHASVRESAVLALNKESGELHLVAYVVPLQDSQITAAALRDHLSERLPAYMIPAAFVMMEALPLTPNRKLDRRALPAPDQAYREQAGEYTAPRSAIEEALAEIWREVLAVEQVGIHDNFFELGGHSLMAVRLFAVMEKRFGKRLPLATLFQAPTIAQLAAILQRDWAPQWSSLVPIQPLGSRQPFFCVHAVGGNVLEYYDLARHLGEDQPFYGLQSSGLDGKQAPHTCIEDMAAHYIKEIREFQPTGPYLIGGRSLGGIIAFEMACQLRAQGQEVGLLALLDSYPVGYDKLSRDGSALRSRVRRIVKRIQSHATNVRGLPLQEKLHYVVDKAQYGPVRIKSQVWQMIYRSYQNLGRKLPLALRDVQEFNWLAARDYVPQQYDGRVALFWASSDLRAKFDLIAGWQLLAQGGMEVQEIPGTHLNIIKEPHVADLAKKLSESLVRAQGGQLRIEQTLGTDSITELSVVSSGSIPQRSEPRGNIETNDELPSPLPDQALVA